MSRKHMAWIWSWVGVVGKPQACWMKDARYCEPSSVIRSAQKPTDSLCLHTHRCLDVEIWQFLCRQRQQTYRPITLPLAHVCRVISWNVQSVLILLCYWGCGQVFHTSSAWQLSHLQLVVCINQPHHTQVFKQARQWEFLCNVCAMWALFQISFGPQKEIKAKLGDRQTIHRLLY